MDCVVPFIYQHLEYAPWIIFGALMLAGFNIPISEDLMLITAGVLAGTVMHEQKYQLFLFAFMGCYFSDWEAYWLGRLLGRRMFYIRWFSKMVKLRRLRQAERFYSKYGMYTLLVGRFIPFGVRNVLFVTAGVSKMHFGKFISSDGIACLISNLTLFYIAYSCGKNYDVLMRHLTGWHLMAVLVMGVCTIIGVVVYRRLRKAFVVNNAKKNLGKQINT